MALIAAHRKATQRKTPFAAPAAVLKALLIWPWAWREYQHIRELDQDALKDVGLSDVDRRSITVRQIASRMMSER